MASIPIKLCSHVFLVDMLHVGRTVVQEDVWVYRFRHSPKNAHQDLKPEPQTQASDVCSYFIPPQTWVLVKEFNLSKLPLWGSIANILVSLIIMVAYAKLLLKSPETQSPGQRYVVLQTLFVLPFLNVGPRDVVTLSPGSAVRAGGVIRACSSRRF